MSSTSEVEPVAWTSFSCKNTALPRRGNDVEQQLVDVRDRCTGSITSTIESPTGSGWPLPFAAASFDIVFSKDAIIHVQDKQASTASVASSSGGRLLVSDWLRVRDGADAAVEQFRRGVGP